MHETPRSEADVLLRMEQVRKTFPNGTVALRGVDLEMERGSVHGLLGANGAGKSTLIRILSGAVQATAGRVIWRGTDVRWRRPAEANAAGVATIHQHIPLVPTLSVLENIFLPRAGLWRRSAADREKFQVLTRRIGYAADPDALVGDLSIGQRQMVAILQALGGGAELIVMDEPTASLATEEREIVYATVRRLAHQEGKAILFVSHFLDEVMALTDRVTVLRDGTAVLRERTGALDEMRIAEAIVGREVAALTHLPHAAPGAARPVLLELRDLAVPGRVAPVSIDLHAGEVIGIAGFLGAGRSELLHAIFGADRDATGGVRVDGRAVGRSTRAAVAAGLALVPEDRAGQGLIPGFELWRNVTLPHLVTVARFGLLPDGGRERARGREAIRLLGIKAASEEVLVTELSGGNAQKVTVAKWLFGGARIFLLDEPTAGIDVGAKADILALVRRLATGGCGIIIVSSEFEELLAVSDRILVLRQGRIVAERNAGETSEHELILLATATEQGAGDVGHDRQHA